MHIHAEGREKASGHDVALSQGIGREQWGTHGDTEGDGQYRQSEPGPRVSKNGSARHQVTSRSGVLRSLGSAHAVSASATRFPATTSVALTAVAAMMTG